MIGSDPHGLRPGRIRRVRPGSRVGLVLGAAAVLVVAVPSAPAAQGGAAAAPAAAAEPLLSPERVERLDVLLLAEWLEYLARSARARELDLATMRAELERHGLPRWVPAPAGDDFRMEREPSDPWFSGPETRRIADAIVSYQTPAGGWSKAVDPRKGARRPGESYASQTGWSWMGTIDNGATTEQLRFLAAAYRMQREPEHRAALVRGIEYLLAAQFPNGCWPQVYPLQGGYHDAATYNDHAMVLVLRLLREVAGGRYEMVPDPLVKRAGAAFGAGVECILDTQVAVGGRRTVWAQQHDPLTLEPVPARAYEPAALTAGESAPVVELLMDLEAPGARVVAAVHAAIRWFREAAIEGYRYRFGGELKAASGSGPLWARYYELGSGRPIFGDRDGEIRYDLRQVSEERRRAYAWYGSWPVEALERYDAWSRRNPPEVPAAETTAHAVVDAGHRGSDGERVDGLPTFRTLTAALAAAPTEPSVVYAVRIRAGRYVERLSIERPRVHLSGDGAGTTVLTFGLAAGHPRPEGGTYGTRGSYTLRVAAPDFRLEGLRVENSFDYAANAALPTGSADRLTSPQAVAVLLDRGSDRAAFRDCTIAGNQDTLFADAGRAHFHRCTILGHVDFVFGAGQAVFEESVLVSLDRGSRTANGYVAAPSTKLSSPYGFLFLRSTLRKERPEMTPGSVALGRPWHPSGDRQAVGSAVFVDCYMDDHISPAGWAPMSGFAAEDARFFEHGSTGPGALRSETRRLLPPEALPYHTPEQVLRGWRPFEETT